MTIGELKVFPFNGGAVVEFDCLLLCTAFDERPSAPDEVVAHKAFPVVGFFGFAECRESGDLPVDFGSNVGVGGQRGARDDSEVVVFVDVEPDLVGDIFEGKVVRRRSQQ